MTEEHYEQLMRWRQDWVDYATVQTAKANASMKEELPPR